MTAGKIVAQGTPNEVITEELLDDAFGLNARVITDPVYGDPLIIPIGTRSARTEVGSSAGELSI